MDLFIQYIVFILIHLFKNKEIYSVKKNKKKIKHQINFIYLVLHFNQDMFQIYMFWLLVKNHKTNNYNKFMKNYMIHIRN